MDHQPRPLDGITVTSIEQAVAAPLATRQLADLGARVIKIERPGGGDFARRYDDAVNGLSSYFAWLNRSKESVVLDLKSEPGREILHALIARSDVFVHNLGPGAAERLGVDEPTVSARYPRVVSCTISGYGTEGPWSTRKAYDLLVQAETGLLSVTGTPDTPSRCGVSIADIAAGVYAFSGVLSALFHRLAHGETRSVSVSLFDALSEWMGAPDFYSRHSGEVPQRVGAQHSTIAPYGPFDVDDGSPVVIAVQNDIEWRAFCVSVLELPELAGDPRFLHNVGRVRERAELNAIIQRRFRSLSRENVVARCEHARIAYADIRSVQELASHPSLVGRDRWRQFESPIGPIQGLVPPASLKGIEPRFDPLPSAGKHTIAILSELGHTTEVIDRLLQDGAVQSSDDEKGALHGPHRH